MADTEDLDSFADVNHAVRDEWKAETTPYERVRAVISRTYTPTGVETLATDACTSPKTARKHLTALVDDGFVETEPGAHGATLYYRSTESLVVEQAASILSELSPEELRDRITELREQVVEFQQTYGVESPEELTVERTNTLLDGSERDRAIPDDETIREWQTTRRNLAFANAALSIANARKFVEPDVQSTDGTASSL
jgi:predicted ArsR family transcriptional regulator